MWRALLIAVGITICGPPAAPAAVIGWRVPIHASQHRLRVGQQATRLALPYRGVPYLWGGTTPAGFDCSGFTLFVYAKLGIDLPHSSYDQWIAGRHVARDRLRAGDLVFFAGSSHVGLYLGAGRFIHAPHTGAVVSVANLDDAWYATTYTGAVRVQGSQRPTLTSATTTSTLTKRTSNRRRQIQPGIGPHRRSTLPLARAELDLPKPTGVGTGRAGGR